MIELYVVSRINHSYSGLHKELQHALFLLLINDKITASHNSGSLELKSIERYTKNRLNGMNRKSYIHIHLTSMEAKTKDENKQIYSGSFRKKNSNQ